VTEVLSFWGKGGVGKTTISFAVAKLLQEETQREVLYISTDPASKFALDSINAFQHESERYSHLSLRVLTEEDVRKLWKERFGEEVYEVASSFLPVDRSIIEYVARAPGISEEFMLYYIWDAWKSGRYDAIVWDTMAAGGSLVLLELERELYSHMGEAARLYLRIRGTLESIRKKGGGDPLKLIESWKGMAESMLSFLSSEQHRAFIISNPDSFSTKTSLSLFDELKQTGVEVKGFILNKALENDICPGCPVLEYQRQSQNFWASVLSQEASKREASLCKIHLIPNPPENEEFFSRISDELVKNCSFLF